MSASFLPETLHFGNVNVILFNGVMSFPSTKIFPLVTVSIVEMQFSNVVLPEPDVRNLTFR